MTKKLTIEINIEDMLYLNRYIADTQSHLVIIDQAVCTKCQCKPCTTFCPARVYEWKDEHTVVGYEGCLECGACRIGCPYANIDWKYPRGGFGVGFRLA
jgi:ferredoxin like protein